MSKHTKNWENWLPWSVSCLDELVLEVLNLEVYIVPHRTPSTLSPYWFKVERSVRVQFHILYASTDIYVNILLFSFHPIPFLWHQEKKFHKCLCFVVLSVLSKKSMFKEWKKEDCQKKLQNGIHQEEENEVDLNSPGQKGLKDWWEKRDWWKKTGMTEVTGGRR